MRRVLSVLGGVFLVSLFFVSACDPGSCPSDSETVWADVEPIFTEHCIACHDSSLTGADRAGALEEYNYDSPEAAAASPNWTWAEVTLGHMPPSEPLAEADQQLIREWLACGGPE